MTRHAQPQQQQETSGLAATAVLGGLLALILSFFAHSFAVFLALVVIVLAVIALVRARGGRPGKREAIVGLVMAVLALFIGSLMSAEGQEGFQQAVQTAPPVDPNALPASVTIATVQSPDNLVTTAGRRLHVTMMQGQESSDPCRTGTDTAAASKLVTGQQVSIAAPDAAHTDTPTAVPAGFQPVVMTLADGRDYAETWRMSAESYVATCLAAAETTTEEPAPTTTTEATSEPDVDVDVDRPYVPAPRTKARSGHSGHPCLPGERDGDGDGYCGE